jgi:hypothetical protein
MSAFRVILIMFYTAGIGVFLAVLAVGLPYYTMPLAARPHVDMHAALKPGGIWGHGLGILGSSMVLLLFLYSGRKRRRFGLRFGPVSKWLDVHIMFGILGPLFITLHTAMKFNGIVSISYFSMMAVMLSGFFGRYIFIQIPRDTRGTVLNLEQLHTQDIALTERMRDRLHLPTDVIDRVQKLTAVRGARHTSGIGAIAASAWHDITLPYRVGRLRRYLNRRKKDVPKHVIGQVVMIARKKSLLARRVALLNAMKRVFYLWHVLHKPFAYVMVIIMFVHVTVTVLLGYRWIF